ncbi:hypothetical protein SKAU_G00325960 [Synaphobranchus kaupii]|uniref:Uncharacterized protein n=1 Tax=Synaphobranchus kaupii TaxID=118154 RepID=A0A9Q1EPK6_SYNKA|nr:hypothetical protein SKAU_G00325960 [Synaphobranchus kaupii]
MQGLVERLPDIHEGAGKWTRALEEETMGKLLVVGDQKALLARLLGMAQMEDVLAESGLQAAVNTPYLDGASFDQFRPAMWRTLREDYPTKIDPKSVKGEGVGDTENPATYLHRHLKRWKLETGRNPEGDELMTTLFRTSIVEVMPPPVRSRLEDVVGLNSKTHREFCDHVIHTVEKHRKDEQKLKEQEKEVQRKLSQLQLGELTKKKKVQAMMKAEVPEPRPEAVVSSGGPPRLPMPQGREKPTIPDSGEEVKKALLSFTARSSKKKAKRARARV